MTERDPTDDADEPDELAFSRRRLLGTAGTGVGMSALGLPAMTGTAAATAIGTGPTRLDEATELRCELARRYVGARTWPGHPDNGDEGLYTDKRGNYIKGLELANPLGEVDPGAYSSLITALTSGDPADFAAIGVGGDRQLVAPQTAHRFRMVGFDPHFPTMPAAPTFASDEMGAEMAEVYWHALVRDVPFADYGSSTAPHTPTEAADELTNQFSNFTGPKQGGQVTLQTLFRMDLPGVLQGPYLSQLLLKPIPYGAIEVDRRIIEAADQDYVTDYNVWLDVISGQARRGGEFPPTSTTAKTGNQRYIRNGRDLGEYVHVNFSYQPYLSAALVLFFGIGAPLDPAAPHTGLGTQDPYLTHGAFSITEVLASVAGYAANAAWFHKWLVHRRLRPETFAGRVHNQAFGNKNYNVSQELMDADVLHRINDVNQTERNDDTLLLPLAYAEGSPAHPSYPSGHAVIAGACVTVLKAFFDESYTIPSPVVPNASGTSLNPISASLTVGGELNKLAANVSIGRDFAGVHYRSDAAAGVRLGEQVAHAAMEYLLFGANEGAVGLEYVDFDGNQRQLY